MTPTRSDIRKRHERIAKWAKLIGADGRMPEKKLMQMLRSAVRQVWMHNPVKLLKLEEAAYPDMRIDTRTKWLVDCECCGEAFKKGDVQVDHIIGGHSLKTIDDLPHFFNNVLNVSAAELQILCKPCHELKTYMEAHPELSREQAIVEKKVIAWFKKHNTVTKQKLLLTHHGCEEEEVSNAIKRKAIVRSVFEQGLVI